MVHRSLAFSFMFMLHVDKIKNYKLSLTAFFIGKDMHSSSVVCLDCHQDNNLILTGSTDATAKIIHASTGKVSCLFHRYQ